MAVLSADVAGYSRLMGRNERETLAALKAHRADLIDAAVAAHGGRIVKTAGDGMLVEFGSVVAAVECAIAVQHGMAARNAAAGEHEGMQFRLGIHLGDVISDGSDIFGDGVNIAARLQEIAEPGGVAVSGVVYDYLDEDLAAGFRDGGRQDLKNIRRPVQVWHLVGSQPRPSPERQPAADRPSIAVLPFDNMSGDGEQEYFSDGITEDLITDLSKVSGLFVIARNSCFAYKGRSVDIRQVCRELGVRYALEGSVRKAGRRVRINAQLIDGDTGGHLWAERYDREMEDIFSVQDEVTREIVEALKVELTVGERARREGRSRIDPVAYDLFVRGRALIYRFNAAAMRESRALLEQATTIEPGFAKAYALLATLHCAEYSNRWNAPGPDHLERALALAGRARDIDPEEPLAYHAAALTHMWLRDLEAAEQAARHSIALDPNFAGAYAALGNVLDFLGRHEEAIEVLGSALRLDPQYGVALQILGRAQFMSQRYAEAEASLTRRLEQAPHSDLTRAYLASLYGWTGRLETARAIWRELVEINPDFTPAHLRQIYPYRDPDCFARFAEGLARAGLET